MKCFLTVLKSIGFVACFLVFMAVVLAAFVLATVGTMYLLGIDPNSAWVIVVAAFYFIVGAGTFIGITECTA